MKPASKQAPGVAVAGSGYWGRNLVRNFNSLGALRLICDQNEEVLEGLKKQYPQAETCLAFNDALSREDIQAVAIATPAETHFILAREALLAGKHVFTEKPLSLHETEGAALVQLAAEKELVLMVGHLLQYHPVFVRLKTLAAGGGLGRINYIYSNRLNLGKIRREENILWSFAPHDISMILALAGEEPESVLATGGYYLHKRIADVTTTHLTFPSGLQAQVFVSWLHPFKDQKLVVVGDKKMAVFDDTRDWEEKLLLYPHEILWQGQVPVPAKADPERPGVERDEPLRLECLHFLDSVRKGKRPLTDGGEGLRVLRVLNAAQESLDKEGMRIPLARRRPPGTEPYFVHPTAVVDEGCEIGEGTKIWHFTHVLKGSHIGKGCNMGQNVLIGPDVSIGDGCKLQNNVSVYKGVTLENFVFCGPSMVFTNVYNPRAELRKMDQARPTLVRSGATIGANATIICGTTLGRYSFVGAGAVVNRNVPDYALVVGNPARRIGWVCECGERLPDDLTCWSCGKRYQQLGETITPLEEATEPEDTK